MEILALLFIWPFMLIAVGLALIAFVDILNISNLGWLLLLVLAILPFIYGKESKEEEKEKDLRQLSLLEQLSIIKKLCIVFSIALFAPIFVKYLVMATNYSLGAMIFSLFFGFGIGIWSMFIKDNPTLVHSNILGSLFVLVYVYFQLWKMGDFTRIIAAGFGLILAVIVSVIKLREKDVI